MQEEISLRHVKWSWIFKIKLCKALESRLIWCLPWGLKEEMMDLFSNPSKCQLRNRVFIQLDSKWSRAETWRHLSAGMWARLCSSASHTDLLKPGPVPWITISHGCVPFLTGWLILLLWWRIVNMKCSVYPNDICVTCIVNTYWHADVAVDVWMLRGYKFHYCLIGSKH